MKPLLHVLSVLTVTFVVMGCADKAQPKYDECVALEGKGDLKGAVAACEAAVAADPESKAGKAAAEKLTAVKAKLKAQEAEAAAKAATEERARAEAARKAREEEDAKCLTWHTFCNTGGPAPQYSSRAECDKAITDFEQIPGVQCAKPCKCLFVKKE